MNDTDVQATNTDYKPKLHKSYKLVLQIWLLIIILSGSVFSKLKYINSTYNSFYAKILIHVIVLFSIKKHMQFYIFILPAVESMIFLFLFF